MDKFQAAFEILYIASVIDGDVDKSEIAVINDFLEANEMKCDFSTHDIIDDLSMLNIEGVLEEFIRASESYAQKSSASEKRILLNFFMSLVISDGEIDDNEMRLFHLITEVFQVDGKLFLTRFLEL